jgi:hypothetical protein
VNVPLGNSNEIRFITFPPIESAERKLPVLFSQEPQFNKNLVAQHAREVSVAPQWIGKPDVFWYAVRTASGTRYRKVDPAKKEKVPLFDHVALAPALSEALKKPLDGDTLRPDRVLVSADAAKLTFVFGDSQYEYDLAANKLKAAGKASALGLHAANVGLLRRAPARRPPDRRRHQHQGSEAEVIPQPGNEVCKIEPRSLPRPRAVKRSEPLARASAYAPHHASGEPRSAFFVTTVSCRQQSLRSESNLDRIRSTYSVQKRHTVRPNRSRN